jgi:hypothetical protein
MMEKLLGVRIDFGVMTEGREVSYKKNTMGLPLTAFGFSRVQIRIWLIAVRGAVFGKRNANSELQYANSEPANNEIFTFFIPKNAYLFRRFSRRIEKKNEVLII